MNFFKNRFIIYMSALLVLILPVVYPQIDLWISTLFYSEGNGFFLNTAIICEMIYDSVGVLLYMLLTLIIFGFVYQLISGTRYRHFDPKSLVYIFLVFVLGSGIIVNAGLKEHAGRARPRQIVAFGGDKQFTPALSPSRECKSNCSFSCGHCSFAFGFFALYFLYPRRRTLAMVLGYGMAVSAVRIIQGGHFFSDVVWSMAIMFLVAKGLYMAIYRSKTSF